MARSNLIKLFRGTRSALTTLASANGLIVGEPYMITDEARIAIGTAINTAEDMAKKSELAAKVTGTMKITVGTTAPSSPAVGDIWIDTN